MPDPANAPTLNHFRMEWNSEYPNGFIHLGKTNQNGAVVTTVGYVRGTNLALDQTVEVQKNNKNKLWTGTIISGPNDGEYGPYWSFRVTNKENKPDPVQDDNLTVTVTNKDLQVSNSQSADPQPAEIP
jgi:hypothetical protein